MTKNNLHNTLESLKKEVEDLRALSAELMNQLHEERALSEKQSFLLAERIKELTCLQFVTRVLDDSTLNPEQAFQQIANIITSGFAFPQLVSCKLSVFGKEYFSDNFQLSESMLKTSKTGENNAQIDIQVFFNELSGESNRFSFLEEEHQMLEEIVSRLDSYIQRELKSSQIASGESRFRTLIESLNEIVFEADSESRLVYISPVVEKFSGFKPEDIVGKSWLDFFVAEDLHIAAQIKENVLKGLPFSGDFRLLNHAGEPSWARVWVNPHTLDGRKNGISGTIADLNINMQLEDVIRSKELLNQSILEASPDLIVVTDNQGKVLYASSRVTQIFGYIKSDDFENKTLVDFLAPESHAKVFSRMQTMPLGIRFGAEEYKAIHKDGHIFDIEVNGETITDQQGIVQKFVFVVRDITQRKQLEQELIRSEQLYRNLVESINDVIYEITIEGVIKYISPTVSKVLGYQPEELEGKSFLSFVHPEDRPYVLSYFKDLGIARHSNFSYRYLARDGSARWVRSSTTPVYKDGKLSGGRGTLVDIHNSKMLEHDLRKLQRAVEQSPLSIVITNLKGEIEYVNPKACESSGYTAEELVGNNPRVLKTGDTPQHDYSAMWKTIMSGKEWNGIFHNKKKNGELYWEASTIGPVFDEHGDVTHFIAIKEDITEKKKVEELLVESEKRFSEMAAQSRTFIWEVDLEGKYTFISPFCEMIIGYSPDELVGKKYFYDLMPPEQREYFKQEALSLLPLVEPISGFENPVLCKNGEIIWVSTDGVPVKDKAGNLIGYRGSDTDITQRHHAQEELIKFRTMTDQANYGSALAGINGELLYVNEAFAKMHGYEVDELLGKPLTFLHAVEHLPEVNYLLQKLFTEGGFTSAEVGHVRKDGSTFPSLMNGNLVKDEAGNNLFLAASMLDISSIKQAEEKIKSQNLRLNAIVEAMPDFIFVSDADGNYLEYLGSSRRTGDDSFKSYVGKNIKDIFDPTIASLHLKNINECLEKEVVITYEYPFFQNNKMQFFEGRLVKLDETRVLRFVRDVTERRIQESEIKKLTIAMEQSPVSILITDLEANIEYANSAFFSTTGYLHEEIIGKNARILKSGLTNDATYAAMWESIRTGQTWKGEWINSRKDGSHFWESISITPVRNEMGEVSSYLAVKEDITDRKNAEAEIIELNQNLEIRIAKRTSELEKANVNLMSEIENRKKIEQELKTKTDELESFFTLALDLLCIADLNGRFIKVNKAWERILGMPVKEIEGKAFLDFVHPDDMQHTIDSISILSDNNPVISFINRYRHRDGSYRYIEWRSVPEGDLVYAAARDITERINNEAELNKARIEAEKANKAKSEFLSRMSHELRTPLNSILGFAQLLEMSELNKVQSRGVGHIMKSGKHLLQLINEVLDISRIESGRISLSLEPVDIIQLIHEVNDSLSPIADNEKIEITLPPASQLYVKADRQRLNQVLLNLLHNAIKYNVRGGKVFIHVSVFQKEDANHEMIKVCIKDTGPGVKKDDIEKIFVPFERAAAEKTDIEGTGLGLAVVKILVEMMNGRIGVESVEGEGAEFWFEIPAAYRQQAIFKEKPVEIKEAAAVAGNKGLVLYIEDNNSNIELVENILNNARPGINLISTRYGKYALQLAIETSPALILLDLDLPDIHGSEVFKILNSDFRTKHIPVAVVTANAMLQQKEKLLNAGVQKYLTKPFEVNDLLSIIDEFIV